MKRRLEKESDAVALAVSAVSKKYNTPPHMLNTLETKFHADAGDWYVAIGWECRAVVVRMDSVLAKVLDVNEISSK